MGIVLWTLAGSSTGCMPLVPEDRFLEFASAVALAPQRTCEQLQFFFKNPVVSAAADPADFGLDFETAMVPTGDGQFLRLWYVPSREDRGTVIFSTGAAGSMSCSLLIPRELCRRGWSVVVYEYQGFGGSTGAASLTTLVSDLDAVMDWTLARIAHPHVTLLGASVGTIPSTAQAARRPQDVNAVILDGAISLRVEIERLWFLYGGRPERYLSQFDETLRLGEELRNVAQPLLAIAYGRDVYGTSAYLAELLAKSPASASVVEFATLGHAQAPYLATEAYFDALDEFLTSVWTPDSE
jgi:pimeloyl-ACP methyl ester carboxylesterase